MIVVRDPVTTSRQDFKKHGGMPSGPADLKEFRDFKRRSTVSNCCKLPAAVYAEAQQFELQPAGCSFRSGFF